MSSVMRTMSQDTNPLRKVMSRIAGNLKVPTETGTLPENLLILIDDSGYPGGYDSGYN